MNGVAIHNKSLEVPLEHTLADPALTCEEKSIRDRFVIEYQVDYQYVSAAVRVGYVGKMASIMAAKFKYEAYVQRQIAAALVAIPDDPVATALSNEQKIIGSLFKEANYRGPGSTHGARVSALSKLVSVCGMDAPVKTQVTHDGSQELLLKTEFDFDNLSDNQLELVRKLLKSQVNGNPGA